MKRRLKWSPKIAENGQCLSFKSHSAGLSDHVWNYEEIAEGDEIKALEPQRSRMVLYFFLQALSLAALFVEKHMKAHMGVVLPTALGAALFMLAGLHAIYNLSPDSN